MDWANAAANVGSHFIVNNLFQSTFVMLWVNSQFWVAEIIVVMNLLNLTSLYFRHRATPPCKPNIRVNALFYGDMKFETCFKEHLIVDKF